MINFELAQRLAKFDIPHSSLPMLLIRARGDLIARGGAPAAPGRGEPPGLAAPRGFARARVELSHSSNDKWPDGERPKSQRRMQ
jgi:hypothetical protein